MFPNFMPNPPQYLNPLDINNTLAIEQMNINGDPQYIDPLSLMPLAGQLRMRNNRLFGQGTSEVVD
jgi:hypothetical protein